MEPGFRDVWAGVERVARENADLIPFVRDEVAARGPISARDLEVVEERDRSNWGWNWSRVKTVLEWLFYVGEVTSAHRNSQFERVYDLPERVIPSSVLAMPTPTPQESVTGLVRRAARALGIASESCLRDYFRTRRGNDAPWRSRHWWRVASSSRWWSRDQGAGPGTCGTRHGCLVESPPARC